MACGRGEDDKTRGELPGQLALYLSICVPKRFYYPSVRPLLTQLCRTSAWFAHPIKQSGALRAV
eukprot:365822-Chlamydomonas_euryale.AAC.1